MDGLECSEITLNEICAHSYDFRIDSEYYKKSLIIMDKMLQEKQSIPLKQYASKITDGTHYTPEYCESGEAFLSALNVKENYLDIDAGHRFISPEAHKLLLKRCNPEYRDVLLRKVGVGKRLACVVPKLNFEFSIFVSVALIKCKKINPYYLATFINSKYGQQQLIRFNKGISQPDLHLEDISRLQIPHHTTTFSTAIEDLVVLAEINREKSRAKYAEAERILNIGNFDSLSQSVSIKSLSESFGFSNRLDAEYYQSKYDSLFDLLKTQSTKPLSGEDGIVTIKKSIEPGSDAYCDEGVSFVRVSDITKFGISESSIKLPSDVVPDVASLYPRKNTILFSKDGSVGIAYKVEKDLEIVTSGALLHLTVKNPKEVLPDYLTLVLNSKVVQLQAERNSNGAIIQHWKPSEIEKVVIPVLDIKTQKQISDKVQESFAMRHLSAELLECAKQAVEIAIEQGEEKAIEWLKDKVR